MEKGDEPLPYKSALASRVMVHCLLHKVAFIVEKRKIRLTRRTMPSSRKYIFPIM